MPPIPLKLSKTAPSTAPFQVETFGIILGTKNFSKCVEFYRDTLNLPVWFTKPGIVCLRFGEGYLMIETGGYASPSTKPNSANPTMLRFNVRDVRAAAEALKERGVDVAVIQHTWGLVGTFRDPDGNKCELKDADDPFFSHSSSKQALS